MERVEQDQEEQRGARGGTGGEGEEEENFRFSKPTVLDPLCGTGRSCFPPPPPRGDLGGQSVCCLQHEMQPVTCRYQSSSIFVIFINPLTQTGRNGALFGCQH